MRHWKENLNCIQFNMINYKIYNVVKSDASAISSQTYCRSLRKNLINEPSSWWVDLVSAQQVVVSKH